MAASVRHNLKLGISAFRCVASPAPARAFVPARGSQVFCCICYTTPCQDRSLTIVHSSLYECLSVRPMRQLPTAVFFFFFQTVVVLVVAVFAG